MIKNVLEAFCKIDERIMRAINVGLLVSLALGTIGMLLILTYNTYSVNYDFFEGGFILIKTGLTFAAQFIGYGLVINQIIKEKI